MLLAIQSFERLTNLTGPEALEILSRAHPMLVHFPIALLLAAALAELGRMLVGRPGRSPIGFYCCVLGTLGALVAGASGWFWADLDPPSARQADLLAWHRWTAVVAAGLATLSLLVGLFSRGESGARAARIYRLLLFLSALAVVMGASKGGELVWGEGYLFEGLDGEPQPAATDEPEETGEAGDPEAAADDPVGEAPSVVGGMELATRVDFNRDVRPIFEASCVECHGAKKKKGSLRLDREDGLYEDDRELWVIQPGSAADSLLFELVTLPEDDEDRMPVDADPLSAEQIEVLRRWIDQGAKWGTSGSNGEVGEG